MVDNDDFLRKLHTAKERLVRMHFESRVGHLGGNLSCIDALMVLFHQFIGKNDDFVLSKGHSAGALYVSLWSIGELSDEDLSTFHGDGTNLPGHPPSKAIKSIPFGTGSLGHGLPLSTGMALGRKLRKSAGSVYCLTSDGEWQEGSMWEALRFSVTHHLDNLVILVDGNGWQGFAETSKFSSSSQLVQQFQSLGAEVVRIDGHQPEEIRGALEQNVPGVRCILLDTIKGNGWPGFENSLASHYIPPDYEFSPNR